MLGKKDGPIHNQHNARRQRAMHSRLCLPGMLKKLRHKSDAGELGLILDQRSKDCSVLRFQYDSAAENRVQVSVMVALSSILMWQFKLALQRVGHQDRALASRAIRDARPSMRP